MSKKQPSILDHYPDYALNIGIEVHVQLDTNSKIFCPSNNKQCKSPNECICNICAGYPGVLPVLNKKVVDFGILAGLATNCTINNISSFARKHYFYPDLPKGYQITQDKDPICSEGFVPIRLEDGSTKNIRLIRIHMEEDAGKNIHASGTNESFVDLNRAGTPLLEIVTYPDIESTYEAKAYLKTLHQIVTYLGICTGNMEEGAFRADTNISVRKKDAKELGTRCEMKNINSFKFIGDAIEHEIERHIDILESGGSIKQETRLWDTHKKITKPMRSKEEAADYRYFPEPDLPLIEINEEWISRIKKIMPELPKAKFDRLVNEVKLTPYEAEILVDNKEIADYFEQARELTKSKQLINWILRDLMGHLKEHKIDVHVCKVTPALMAELLELQEKGTINAAAAKEVFEIVAQTGQKPADVVKEKGLEQIGSPEELEAIVKEIVDAHPDQVAQLKSGKDRMFGFFVGQAMKKTEGKGNPKIIQELLKKHLS
ncbi:MAG: Asp-tRNA(Asn)/Glu-tRNA(Gln) amidotransferase subunit GatB [Candidatus Dependentiae bacterium]